MRKEKSIDKQFSKHVKYQPIVSHCPELSREEKQLCRYKNLAMHQSFGQKSMPKPQKLEKAKYIQ